MKGSAHMSKASKAAKAAEQAEALENLREHFPVGSTVHTVLRHVTKNGMSRSISVIVPTGDGINDVSWLVAKALDRKFDVDHGGVKMGGAGMDMGFALAYDLSRSLYPNGFHCLGAHEDRSKRCPSNDHSNDYGMIHRAVQDEFPVLTRFAQWGSGGFRSGPFREAVVALREIENERYEAADLYSTSRLHHSGGYALNHRWV
jgi:hypothetical protein